MKTITVPEQLIKLEAGMIFISPAESPYIIIYQDNIDFNAVNLIDGTRAGNKGKSPQPITPEELSDKNLWRPMRSGTITIQVRNGKVDWATVQED